MDNFLQVLEKYTTFLYKIDTNLFLVRMDNDKFYCEINLLKELLDPRSLDLALQVMRDNGHNTAEFGLKGYFTISYNSDIIPLYKEIQ